MRNAAYSALRARARLTPAGPPPRVLVNSIPKAGTHLLTAALEHVPNLRPAWVHVATREVAAAEREEQPLLLDSQDHMDRHRLAEMLRRPKYGQYATAHLFPYPALLDDLDDLRYRVVFMVRDPRDVVVSMTAYRGSLSRHPQRRRYREALRTDEARLLATIEGVPGDEFGPASPSFGRRLSAWAPWLSAPNTLSCRFEDLVGPRGGGSTRAQVDTIRRIGDHIDRPLDEEQATAIVSRTWSPKSPTFRAGKVGGWRAHFSGRVRDAFAREVGDELLRTFGYDPG